MSKWFNWKLKFKQLVTLKHALESQIKNRERQIVIAYSDDKYKDMLPQLQKDLEEEETLYKELSEWIEELRTQFN